MYVCMHACMYHKCVCCAWYQYIHKYTDQCTLRAFIPHNLSIHTYHQNSINQIRIHTHTHTHGHRCYARHNPPEFFQILQTNSTPQHTSHQTPNQTQHNTTQQRTHRQKTLTSQSATVLEHRVHACCGHLTAAILSQSREAHFLCTTL